MDDTNLRAKYVRGLMEIADRANATVEIVDFTDVTAEECVRRDSLRPELERVSETVIREMHTRHLARLKGKPLPIPQAVERTEAPDPYEPKPGTPKAVLVDIDGTVALMGDRSPYDESRVMEDDPNPAVIETVRALVAAGHVPVFMSGRTEGCRADTEAWLTDYMGDRWAYFSPPTGPGECESSRIELHMREVGDQRPDHVVKLELFNAHVRDRYDVRVVLDDRDQVVRLWRSIGLTCLQVAPGDF